MCLLRTLLARESKQWKATHKPKRVRSVVDSFDDLEVKQWDGDVRYHKVLERLSKLSPTRSPQQVRFHTSFVNACLPHIFGESEWSTRKQEIMKNLGVDRIPPGVMALTERRFGKTWAVAMFCAAMLLEVPGIKITVFSVSGRASGRLMRLILSFIVNKTGDGAERIGRKTKEILTVLQGPFEAAELECLPGSINQSRGAGANIVILEEAAFIKEEMFNVLIVPLIGVGNTTFIGITTPQGTQNYYSRLIRTKNPDGSGLLFEVLHVERSCLKCKRLGVGCPHRRDLAPEWKPISGQRIVETLLKHNPRLLQREALGMVVDDHVYMFSPTALNELRRSERFMLRNESVQVVYIGIDPEAGAARSDYAVSALVTAIDHLRRRFIVLAGVESVNTTVFKKVTDMVLGFMNEIMRKRWAAKRVLFVVGMEANMSFHYTNQMNSMLQVWANGRRQGDAVVYSWKHDEFKYGIWTGAGKLSMIQELSSSVTSGAFAIASDSVILPPTTSAPKDEIAAVLDEFGRVRLEEPPLKDYALEKVRVGVSGKTEGYNDDRFMSLVMAHHVVNTQWDNKDFTAFANKQRFFLDG